MRPATYTQTYQQYWDHTRLLVIEPPPPILGNPMAWILYDQFKLQLGKKIVNLATDTFQVALFTNAGNAGMVSVNPALYTNLTAEVANGNGYATGGVSVSPSWTNLAGVETFDLGDASWNVTGSGFSARYAVIWDPTSGSALCFCLLDSTPADIVTTPGFKFTIQMNVAGVFTAT